MERPIGFGIPRATDKRLNARQPKQTQLRLKTGTTFQFYELSHCLPLMTLFFFFFLDDSVIVLFRGQEPKGSRVTFVSRVTHKKKPSISRAPSTRQHV